MFSYIANTTLESLPGKYPVEYAMSLQRPVNKNVGENRFKGARAESKRARGVHKKHPSKIELSPLRKASQKILNKKLLIFMQRVSSWVPHEEKNLHLRTG
jgi:hypothetical protein